MDKEVIVRILLFSLKIKIKAYIHTYGYMYNTWIDFELKQRLEVFQAFKATDHSRIWTAVQYGNWLLSQFHHGQSEVLGGTRDSEEDLASTSKVKNRKEGQGRKRRRDTEIEKDKKKTISLNTKSRNECVIIFFIILYNTRLTMYVIVFY
jgi:hypothetical protein